MCVFVCALVVCVCVCESVAFFCPRSPSSLLLHSLVLSVRLCVCLSLFVVWPSLIVKNSERAVINVAKLIFKRCCCPCCLCFTAPPSSQNMSSGQNEAAAAAKKEKVFETQQRTQESGSENEVSKCKIHVKLTRDQLMRNMQLLNRENCKTVYTNTTFICICPHTYIQACVHVYTCGLTHICVSQYASFRHIRFLWSIDPKKYRNSYTKQLFDCM